MFKKLLLITIVAVFFLIFVGSVVRSSGSGMGCPDWPKCFGKLIPPTDESQLPSDYVERYKEERLKKNHRLEQLFIVLGLEAVLHDKQQNHTTYNDVSYSFTKAWTEYINRLVGVLVGFLVLGVFIFSFPHWPKAKLIVALSFVSLIVLLFEAFLGSVVVSTNLFPELISLHMVLALLLVFLLMFIYFKLYHTSDITSDVPTLVKVFLIFVLFTSFVQLILGISVRELVDVNRNQLLVSQGIILKLGIPFYIHRSFSIIVLLSNFYLFFIQGRNGLNNKWSRIIIPMLLIEIFTGIILANFDLPRFCQPFHLLFASLLIGMQFLNFLNVKFASINR